MALSCTAAMTIPLSSTTLSCLSACDTGSCASAPFLPTLSSAVLVRSKNRTRSSEVITCYGTPAYGAPRPYQTPGADFHFGARLAETISHSSFGEISKPDFSWNHGAPLNYSSPVNYQTPKGYGAPYAYGPGVGSTTTELGQEADIVEEAKEAELDSGDVGGGGEGDDDGGSGDGRGDGKGDDGEGADDGKKKKAGMSMSQKLTLAYAILVGVGGLMGFAKSGSSKSLMAGGGSASILYYVYLNLPSNPVMASAIGLGISGMLLFIMGSRYMESGKVFPAGVVSLFSLVMAGGYIHGIVRSAHH
ncbi:uncharacterized protein [Physcomitrium patens]|uniref:Uncharacterized protein n=1 Tax=Physcomitrium patens TaxID=3218 RepID=A0A2K1IIY7_PHYPA|nr:protein FATTY ACID EXPORT 2, chloroplastic-like [Physcomitrium patens]PNR29236.1 hypothetical protein PHYPA_027928 [Physcomitrium patens]|eukprot:XP_024362701.1 protein FATTY ACID EXPORT 2, chloroplastic-like [Physcomitrella patens]